MKPTRMHLCPTCGHAVVAAPSLRIPQPIEAIALRALAQDLDTCPADCWRFFELIFSTQRPPLKAHELAKAMGLLPSTFMSRFYRANLPSPKTYAKFALFVRIARAMEDPQVALHQLVIEFDQSSVQQLCRSFRVFTGLTARAFRQEHTGVSALKLFRERYVLPYRETLLTFSPTSHFAPSARPLAVAV